MAGCMLARASVSVSHALGDPYVAFRINTEILCPAFGDAGDALRLTPGLRGG